VNCLMEGCSIRATVRMTGVAKKTVMRVLVEVGAICEEYQDRTLRNLTCRRVQLDELWGFNYCKQKNVTTEIASKVRSAGVALYYFSYNFIKIYRTLRVSPAMTAGVTDRLWEVSDLIDLWESEEAKHAA
jgi:hypothetical protein